MSPSRILRFFSTPRAALVALLVVWGGTTAYGQQALPPDVVARLQASARTGDAPASPNLLTTLATQNPAPVVQVAAVSGSAAADVEIEVAGAAVSGRGLRADARPGQDLT
jgi:hypothetical protein